MEESFLELHDINLNLPNSKKTLFYNLNLELSNKLSIIGVLGSNGSGKTILAKMLSGLVKIKSGQIKIFNTNITRYKTTKRLNYISMSFQMINMSFIRHTVKDEIDYNQNLLIKRKKQLINSKEIQQIQPKLFSEKEMQHPLTLSGGEKRKLSFYLLKESDPKCYILDEPTVGLDYYGVQELKKDILELKNQNKKIIIITHNLQFLLSLTDEVIILHKDTVSQISSILYQGSLTSYLLNNKNEANQFLSIPLEFEIYRDKLETGEISQGLKYENFLQSNSN